ncbi:uncharacterized protein EDB91DRAFT_1250918 [Suillus paluster]|uniref:uncharacterized protein n=1 Tax=Suillus paluster TaxID=48578 RepID=UPI001B866D74|nr:uncharacterized protein EDB91DRAFT_1250918 [Suillus paluster]KAG1734409.1 hypothetical protein EDB91DRAFT_1250918 [Suillus paluster]
MPPDPSPIAQSTTGFPGLHTGTSSMVLSGTVPTQSYSVTYVKDSHVLYHLLPNVLIVHLSPSRLSHNFAMPSGAAAVLENSVIPSINTFNSIKHISPSILPITTIDSNNVRSSTFHIPWTKTTNTEGMDINITAHSHATCPHTALLLHLSASSTIPNHAPLFSFETSNNSNSWSPMTKPWFMKCCNDIWVATGHPHMPGHTFRIGGATKLLLEGVPPDIVAMQGRWKSQAFLDYWHKIESILPLFISTAITSSTALLHLQSVMQDFHHHHSASTNST